MEPELKKQLRSKMKQVLTNFAVIEAANEDERQAREDLEKEIRQVPRSWEFLCGMAEGVNVITEMYPRASNDATFRLVARLVIIVTAKVALEAIQDSEDEESPFPEDLPI